MIVIVSSLLYYCFLGWAKIRFIADNPGVWINHCHIDWHMAAGLINIFIETPFEMLAGYASGVTRYPAELSKTCDYVNRHISIALGSDVTASASVSGSDQMIILIASASAASIFAILVFLYFYYYHIRVTKPVEISLSNIQSEEKTANEIELQKGTSADELISQETVIYFEKN